MGLAHISDKEESEEAQLQNLLDPLSEVIDYSDIEVDESKVVPMFQKEIYVC